MGNLAFWFVHAKKDSRVGDDHTDGWMPERHVIHYFFIYFYLVLSVEEDFFYFLVGWRGPAMIRFLIFCICQLSTGRSERQGA